MEGFWGPRSSVLDLGVWGLRGRGFRGLVFRVLGYKGVWDGNLGVRRVVNGCFMRGSFGGSRGALPRSVCEALPQRVL